MFSDMGQRNRIIEVTRTRRSGKFTSSVKTATLGAAADATSTCVEPLSKSVRNSRPPGAFGFWLSFNRAR